MRLPKTMLYVLPRVILSAVFLFLCDKSRASFMEDMDVRPRATLWQAFDDNVTFSKTNKREDLVTAVSAGLDIAGEGKTYSVEIGGNIHQRFFARETGFNNISQDWKVNAQKEFSPYDRILFRDTFTRAEEPRSFEDDFGRTSGRYSYHRNIFDVSYTKDVSRHLSVQGHYGNESYGDSRENAMDSFLQRLGLEGSYIKSSATAFLFGYDFTTRVFESGGTAYVHTLVTGFRHFLTRQISVDTRAGVSMIESFGGDHTSEPSIFVVLTDDLSETDTVALSYRKTSSPSSYTSDIFDSWRVSVDLGRQLLERLRTAVSVFFGEGQFCALGIKDQQTGVSARLTYDVSKDAQAFGGYTYSEVNSNMDSRGYTRNLVEWGFQIHF